MEAPQNPGRERERERERDLKKFNIEFYYTNIQHISYL
jgi:hypothetical protein